MGNDSCGAAWLVRRAEGEAGAGFNSGRDSYRMSRLGVF